MPEPDRRRLVIPQSLYDEMLAQAWAELPRECCGLLAGQIDPEGTARVSHRYPLINAAENPAVEYLSEKESLKAAYNDMRRRGLDILAVYHSHPSSLALPSARDRALSYGPSVVDIIISLAGEAAQPRAWRLSEDSYEEAEWTVVPDQPL